MKDLFELEGVKDYMVKPYRPEDLLKKVRSNLGEE
jgi:DNA-binding response OmpR family regulator